MKFIAAACIKGDNKAIGIKTEDMKGEGPGKTDVSCKVSNSGTTVPLREIHMPREKVETR